MRDVQPPRPPRFLHRRVSLSRERSDCHNCGGRQLRLCDCCPVCGVVVDRVDPRLSYCSTLYCAGDTSPFPFPFIPTSYDAAAVRPLVQLGGDCCVVTASLPTSPLLSYLPMISAAAPRQLTPILLPLIPIPSWQMSIGQRSPASVAALPHLAVSSPPPLSRRCR